MSCFSGSYVAQNSNYNIHIFKESGTFTPAFTGNVEVLVVAGGGGGGMDMGGGGGGGGVIYNTAYAVTAGIPIAVTVGRGGYGAPAANGYRTDGTGPQPGGHQYTIPATNGENSVFGSLTAVGGGFGGSSYRGHTPGIAGGSGGSGGGSSGYNDNAGTFYGGAGTAGQGYRGGNSTAAYYSGGGGGAGGQGVDSTAQPNGGPGLLCSILETDYYWGGGGGGASYSASTGGNGGIGGGGGGALGVTAGGYGLNTGSPGGGGAPSSWANMPGGNGAQFTGGGGGGGSHYNANNKGGEGGSGIVIVRYLKTSGTVGTGQVSTKSNLILHLDAANRKSFCGIGVERIGGIGPTFGSWGGLTGSSTTYTGKNGKPAVYLRTEAGGGVNYWYSNTGGYACLPSTQYMITARVKWAGSSTTPSANLFYVRQYDSAGAQTSEGGRFSGGNIISEGNDWFITWALFTTDAAASSFYVHGYEYSGGMNIWLEDVQCKLAGVSDIYTTKEHIVTGAIFTINDKALSFNGTSDYVQTSLVGTYNNMTYDFWSYFDDPALSTTSRSESILGDWTTASIHFGTRWSVGMHWNVNDAWNAIPNTNLVFGWNHYSLVWSNSTNEKLVYINGKLSSSATTNGTITLNDFKIGNATNLNYYYRGKLVILKFTTAR